MIRERLPAPLDVLTAVGRSRTLRPMHRPIGRILPWVVGKVNRKHVASMAGLAGRRAIAISLGAPATQLTGTTLKENLQDGYTMFRTIEKAVVTWKLDADFIISDVTVEAEACGCEIEMPEDSQPYVISSPIRQAADLRSKKVPDPYRHGRMPVFLECVRHLSRRFTLPTGAGCIGPYALASQLMGTEEAAIATIEDPGFLDEILEYCLEVSLAYLKAFEKEGAEVIVIADAIASVLSPKAFRRFSGRYIKRIVEQLNRPVALHICGDASHLIEEMCDTGAYSISLDSPVDMDDALKRAPADVIVAGNLDPVEVFLEMDGDGVAAKTREQLFQMRNYPNYLPCPGCELPPLTPLDNIKAYVETVRSFR